MTKSDQKIPKVTESCKNYHKIQQMLKSLQTLLKMTGNYNKLTNYNFLWPNINRKANPGFDPDPGFEKSFPGSGSGSRINWDPGINPGIPQGPAGDPGK